MLDVLRNVVVRAYRDALDYPEMTVPIDKARYYCLTREVQDPRIRRKSNFEERGPDLRDFAIADGDLDMIPR